MAPGATSATISVTVTGDGIDEPDETVTVEMSMPVNAQYLTSDAAATGTITDDDAAPTVELALSHSSISENGGAATVTATLSHPSSAATTVTVTGVTGFYAAGVGRDHRDRGGRDGERLGYGDDRRREQHDGRAGPARRR